MTTRAFWRRTSREHMISGCVDDVPHLLFQQWVGVREVALSRFASPMSIRDQIVRSRLLARQLVEAEVLAAAEPDDEQPASARAARRRRTPIADGTVVVIGAGAAGVAFALEILDVTAAGIRVLLVERDDRPFAQQAGAPHRIVHPTRYEWPNPYWDADQFGADRGEDPLSFVPISGSDLADGWTSALRAAVGRDALASRLSIAVGVTAEVLGPTHRARNVLLTATPRRTARTWPDERPLVGRSGEMHRNDVVLVAHAFGIGVERTSPTDASDRPVTSFHGRDFWSDDHLQVADLAKKTTLISGAGDGAIQDLIRVATGANDPLEMLERLLGDYARPLLSALEPLAPAFAHETAIWATGSKQQQEHANVALDRAIRSIVSRELNLGVRCDVMQRTLSEGSSPTIHFVRRGESFTHCYPLNRVAALVLFELLPTRLVLRNRSTVTNVAPGPSDSGHSHVCAPPPDNDCSWMPHIVTIEGPTAGQTEVDGLIIRNGRLGSDPANNGHIAAVRGLIPATGWRQLLPFDLPNSPPCDLPNSPE